MTVTVKRMSSPLLGAAALILLLAQAACGSETTVTPTSTAMEPSTPEPTAVTEPTATSTRAAPSPPGNVPLIPGEALLIRVIDQQGQPVQEGTVEASIEHADRPELDYGDSFSLAFFQGLIPVSPPPDHTPGTVSLRVVTPDGGVSDTLVIRSDEYTLAFLDSELDFLAVHEFDLSKPGVTTNLKLITIDINPGADPNCINLGSEDVISVAILATPLFDAADVDQSSLTLEGAAGRVKGKSGNIGSFEDVDGDGDLDLVVQFPTADLQLTEAETAAVLEGDTVNGTPIQGVDAICVAPAPTSTSTDTAPSPPGTLPLIPGANLLISVIDEQGQPVQEGTVEASFEHAGRPELDFQDSFDLASFPDGLIPVHPTTPEQIPGTVSIKVVTPSGGVSDTLVIRNDEYGLAFVDTETGFVAVHEFDLSKTGVTTNLKLVIIDIKPGSDPNCINLGSENVISVAILGTLLFDPSVVDQTSVTLKGVFARVKGKSDKIGSFEDVDGDGDLDLVVQFPTADLQLTEADIAAVLEGVTVNGTPMQGVDAICVVS